MIKARFLTDKAFTKHYVNPDVIDALGTLVNQAKIATEPKLTPEWCGRSKVGETRDYYFPIPETDYVGQVHETEYHTPYLDRHPRISRSLKVTAEHGLSEIGFNAYMLPRPYGYQETRDFDSVSPTFHYKGYGYRQAAGLMIEHITANGPQDLVVPNNTVTVAQTVSFQDQLL